MEIKVEYAAAFLKLAKDLQPMGRIVVFDGQNYRFAAIREGHLIAVTYSLKDRRQVTTDGRVTVERRIGKCYGFDQLCQEFKIQDRIESRMATWFRNIRKMRSTTKPVTMRWTSSDPHIGSIRITLTQLPESVTIQYTDTHIKELTKMLIKSGLLVTHGNIGPRTYR